MNLSFETDYEYSRLCNEDQENFDLNKYINIYKISEESSTCSTLTQSNHKASSIDNYSMFFSTPVVDFKIYNDEDKEIKINNNKRASKKTKIKLKPERKANPINNIIKSIINDQKLIIKSQNEIEEIIHQNMIDINTKEEDFIEKKKNMIFITSNHKKKNCCNCKKSHCLKLYCDCFKKGRFCNNCNCSSCFNKEEFTLIRKQSVKFLNYKRKSLRKNKSNIGCSCTASKCSKKYCECFQNGNKCSDKCKCNECLNIKDKSNINSNKIDINNLLII